MRGDKQKIKQQIIESAMQAKRRNEEKIKTLKDQTSLSAYAELVHQGVHGAVWTEALQRALNEHEVVVIPPSAEVYWLDSTVVIPSNRRIEAVGATVRLTPEYPYIMLRNEHVGDGTYAPIGGKDRDVNISIHGGRWEECAEKRGKRRYHGRTDSFFGVQTCMLFNNIEHLTMTDVTFAHALAFCVQVGDLIDGVFENFFFESCFADGLHVNGNSENLYIRNFRGHVGDDLVAMNMYDWLGSSVNFGPAKNVFCEEIHSAHDSRAKAMRLQPGMFVYRDGTTIDCSLSQMVFQHLSGIYEYKLYFQSPPYRFGEKPEGAGAGSADDLFFEDVHVISNRERYPSDQPGTGDFGMFFVNSNVGYLSLKDIFYTKPEGDSPRNHLVAVGPMTWNRKDKEGINTEVFDPYISGTLDVLEMENIRINGERATSMDQVVKIIAFDDVNRDGFSSGKGTLNHVFLDGKQIK